MAPNQWTKPPEPLRVVITDNKGFYAHALITFDQMTDPELARSITKTPGWTVIFPPRLTEEMPHASP